MVEIPQTFDWHVCRCMRTRMSCAIDQGMTVWCLNHPTLIVKSHALSKAVSAASSLIAWHDKYVYAHVHQHTCRYQALVPVSSLWAGAIPIIELSAIISTATRETAPDSDPEATLR